MTTIEIIKNIRLTNKTSLEKIKTIFEIIGGLCSYNCGALAYEAVKKEELKSKFKIIGGQNE